MRAKSARWARNDLLLASIRAIVSCTRAIRLRNLLAASALRRFYSWPSALLPLRREVLTNVYFILTYCVVGILALWFVGWLVLFGARSAY